MRMLAYTRTARNCAPLSTTYCRMRSSSHPKAAKCASLLSRPMAKWLLASVMQGPAFPLRIAREFSNLSTRAERPRQVTYVVPESAFRWCGSVFGRTVGGWSSGTDRCPGRSFVFGCQPSRRHNRFVRIAILLVVFLVVGVMSGCSSSGPYSLTREPEAAFAATSLEEYLRLADDINRQDVAGRRLYLQRARAQYGSSPTFDTRLRLALVLSAPGSSNAELAEASRLLSELANRREARRRRLAELIALRLEEVGERRRLSEAIARLQARVASLQRANDTIARQRSDTVAELERVRAALAEAETKIDALMSIERSIERPARESK